MDNSSRNVRFNVPKKNELSSKKNHLISVFKSFEVTLNDKKKKYFDKIQSLLIAWDQLAVYVSATSSESPSQEFELLFNHTLRFVLRADWPRTSPATQTHLTVTLQRFITGLSSSKRHPSILQQCRVLESIVKNPWSHPVLSRIFADEEVEIDCLLEYFQYENGKVIVVRLEMMLEAQCEDLALRLSKSCLLTYNNSHPLELDFNQDEIDYITDIYFCTLYRDKKKKELTNEIKLYELDEGLQLLKRYNKNGGVGKGFNDNCKDVRVWKYSFKVMELVANTLLANAVLHDDLVDSDMILPDLIAEWATMQKPEDGVDFSPTALEIIRKLVISAGSSKCIYPFCSFLIENCACKELYLSFVAQCLIHAINQNMNEIESYRVHRDYDNLKSTYEQLSQGFVLISRLFDDYKNIYRECLLTSFSLTPSREGLEELETFIVKSIREEPRILTVTENDPNIPDSLKNTAQSDPHDVDSSKNVAENDQIVPGSPKNIVEDDENLSISSTNVPNNDLVFPSSSKNATKNDQTSASQLCEPVPHLNGTEHVEVDEKIVIDSEQPNTETGSVERVVALDENVDSASKEIEKSDKTEILSGNEDLLSLATDTKLKSVGAVEEIEREAAPAYCAEVENLKLDDSMKTDLSSILRYQRFRSLSWELDWSELKINCENFLEVFEKRGFYDVELKYLDIDYSQFKDKPINEDDYIGYEKGYEHFAEPEPEWEEWGPEHVNGDWPHSSGDTDDEYALKRRKKIIRRNKLKKVKAKMKATYDGSSEEFVNSPDNAIVTIKKRKVSTDSADAELKVRKKRVKKFKTSNETDVAIDSQSENYPPDDMNLLKSNEVVEELQNTSSLQLLKQFRIGTKTSSGGELSEIVNNDAKLNLTPVKIVIPKCDNEIDAFEDSDTVVEKRIKPRISVTLPVPGKRSTMQPSTKRDRRPSSSDSLHEFSARCEVRLPKSDSIEEMLSRETDSVVSMQLEEELKSLLESFDTSHPESKESALLEGPAIETPAIETSAIETPAIETPSTENDLVENEPVVTEVKKEPISDPLSKPILIKRRTRKEKVGSEFKKPRGRPKKTANFAPVDPFTFLNYAASSSASPSGTLPSSVDTLQTERIVNSYLANSYLQPSAYTSISCNNRVPNVPSLNYPNGFLNVNHFPANNSGSWNPNCTSFSYLNASMFQNSIAVSSGNVVPTCAQTTTVQSSQSMCSVYTNSAAASSESAMISSPVYTNSNTSSTSVSNYTQTENLFMNETQTTSPVSANSDVAPPCNVTEALSNTPTTVQAAVHTNVFPTLSPTVAFSPNHTQTPPTVNDGRFPMLHQALHDTSNEGSIAPVQQIPGKYNEIVFKFPDMQQTTASRKQTINGVKCPKQPRKLKKDITSSDEKNNQTADGQPVKVKRQRKSKKDITVSDHQPSLEANQQPLDGQPVKANRKRQPKKDKTLLNHQLPFGPLPEASEQLPSISSAPDQSHELSSTPLTTVQPSLDGQKSKVKRPRKPKADNAATNDQSPASQKKKQIRPRKPQGGNSLPPFFMTQMNVQPSSVPALPNLVQQQSLDHSTADQNPQQSFSPFITNPNYQTSVAPNAYYPGNSGEIEIKQPQQPKIDVMFGQTSELVIEESPAMSAANVNFGPTSSLSNPNECYYQSNGLSMREVNLNSYLQPPPGIPSTLYSNYQPNMIATGVNYPTVGKVGVKRTKKQKKDITSSDDQLLASPEEIPPKKLGRPRKPKQDRSAVFPVSGVCLEPPSSTSSTNINHQELSSYSIAGSNLLPSLVSSILNSNCQPAVLGLGADHTSAAENNSVEQQPQKQKVVKPRAKGGRARKSDSGSVLLQYLTSTLPTAEVNHEPSSVFLGPNSNHQSSTFHTDDVKPQPYPLPTPDSNYQPFMPMAHANQLSENKPIKIKKTRKPKVATLLDNQPLALSADGAGIEVKQPTKRKKKDVLDGQPPKPRRPSKPKKGTLSIINQSPECFVEVDHQPSSVSTIAESSQPDFVPQVSSEQPAKVKQPYKQKKDQSLESFIPPVSGMMNHQAPPISVLKADQQESLSSVIEVDHQPAEQSLIMKQQRKQRQNIILTEHASGFSVSGVSPVLPPTLENVIEPARQPCSSLPTDMRYPRVLLPELKMVDAKLPLPNSNPVRRAAKPRTKKEKNNVNSKTIYNGCPQVEVRIPPISLSHFQQGESKQTTDTSFNPATFNQYSSTSQFPAALNGLKVPPQSESRSPSSNEYEAGLSVRLTSSDQPTNNVPLDQEKRQRTPKFCVPKTSRTSSNNDTSAPFINASTPKMLADGYSVIAVPDLSSISNLQKSTNPSYQGQFVNHLQQQQYSQLYNTNVYHGNSMSQQFVCDDNPFGSSQNQSNPPMQMNVEQGPPMNNYYPNNYSVIDCNTSSTSSGNSSLTQNVMVANIPTAGLENVKVQYNNEDINNDSEGVCISIPENAISITDYDESVLGNYLPLIKNTSCTSNSFPPSDQNISSASDLDDLLRQFFPEQMTTFESPS